MQAMANVELASESTGAAVAALLAPRSIAIVGASEKSRWSQALVANLERGGYDGALHLVNRRGGIVHGREALTGCAGLAGPLDLGIVLVPATAILEAVDDLGRAGARAALILTSGFAETGPAGAALQAEVSRRARDHRMRLLGPNSLGFVNFAGQVHAWTTPVRAPSKSSGVAIVSQSGATAFFLAELAYHQDVGLSCVVGTGNEADLEASAFVEYLADDPHTRAIALFIETVRDPARFLAACARAARARKPIVVLKVGAGEASVKSAAAHTGALVGDERVFDGICAQANLIRVRSIEELLATADLGARTGVLRAGGLAILSNSGGICEIAADTAEARGIAVPALSERVLAGLRDALPGFGTPHNPLDLTGGVEPARCGDAVRLMAGQDGIAAVLCVWYAIPNGPDDESERLTDLHRHLSAALRGIAVPGVLACYTHTHQSAHARAIVKRIGAPYCAFGLDRTIGAFAGMFRWSTRQRRLAAATLVAAPVTRTGERPASEYAALAYLAGEGVPVVPVTLATDAAAAVAAARALGGPVALKIASPDIAHKSDIGAVLLNVDGDDAVAAGHDRIIEAARLKAPGARIDGVLVAPMRERGIELIVGVARDPQWGQVLAVGLGGVWVETLKDVALRVLPVDEGEIRAMLAELRGAKLLAGQRGVPAANIDALATAIARIAHAAARLGPDLAAMDVNPLWVRGDRVEALDALFVFDAKDLTAGGEL